ncbi:MarR family transcriptional regulator [Halobacteriales archaeon QH_8_68_33]|nr:MAG: MarR family transcriptional regulator [Halobacteriales archaeon QH_8_68_33]
MDSADLLDLLGNANRRRILQLLAHKPCYVTEISEYLGVSPKAVIDHLEKLEVAGLVESRVDEKRRKYFHIARNLRLEVNVSPYEFGTKSAYPASAVDVTTCRYVSIEAAVTDGEDGDADTTELARQLDRLQDLETELSMAQRWVHGRLTEVMEELTEQLAGEDSRLLGDVLSTLAAGSGTVDELSRRVEAPPEVVAEALHRLAEEGIVVHDGDEWRLPD